MERLNKREDIFGHEERRYVEAYIPELDKVARFCSLSVADREEMESFMAGRMQKEPGTARVMPIVKTLVNEDGLRIYTEDDAPLIAKQDDKIIDAMLDVINTHCVNREPVDKLVALAKKNCETVPSD